MILNLEGDFQVVGEVIDFPGGTKTLGVEGVPWGDKTSGMTLKGDVVPGGDGQGRG